MSMYVVKRDDGEWLSFDDSREGVWYTNNPTIFNDKRYAEAQNTHLDGSHVVELIEAPAKVVVSEEEAEMLRMAKTSGHPYGYIYAHTHTAVNEDRLMRAYVNGYTVEKPKRYVLPMPGTGFRNYQIHGNAQYYAVKRTGSWRPDTIALGTDDAVKRGYTVTQSDIDTAPAWVKAIKPFEVKDDEK